MTLSIAGLGWLDETELETLPRQNIMSSDVVSLSAGESPSQGPPERHATADQITTLVAMARSANVDLEAFGHDMRRLMRLPETQKVTKKFLREHMTMAQYDAAREGYGEALRQGLEEDVPTHEPPSPNLHDDVSPAVPEADSTIDYSKAEAALLTGTT